MASAGRVLPINKGEYNSATAYSPLDIVSYNGTTFCCKKSCTNVTPVEGEYWQCWIDISGKVDKVQGKGLSTNDFDNTYKGNVDDLVEALPLVQTSVRSIDAQINTPTTGLDARVEALETSNTEYESYSIDNSNKTKTNAEVLTDMYNHFKTIGANYRYCEVDYIDISGNIGNINTTIFNTTVPFMLGVSSYTVKNTGLSNPISPHMTTAIVGGIFTVQTFGYMMTSIDLGSSTKSIVTYDTITQTSSGTTTNTQNVIDENNTTEIIKSITVRYKPMVKR